jgi:N-acetylglucosaminyl-diphospho-decaprenol L-rhamnosyltransferase
MVFCNALWPSSGESRRRVNRVPLTPAISKIGDTAAVIVTHRRAELARACAELVAEELDLASIVVVVNEPCGAPQSDLGWLMANVGSTLLNSTARGYGANVNAGVRELAGRYDYYLVMNDDVMPTTGAISKLRETLERGPETALTGPRLVDGSGHLQATAFRFPTIPSELASAIILPSRIQNWLWRKIVSGEGTASSADVWLVGAALLIRASAFHEVNGFDERFFLYSEETDLAYRMRLRGWSSCACDEAVAVHMGAQSTAERRYRRLPGTSRWRYLRKHWPLARRVSLLGLLSLTYLWNSAYVTVRIVLQPRSFRAKLRLWAAHWSRRPFPAVRPLAQRMAGPNEMSES